jgi:hypothetical protein
MTSVECPPFSVSMSCYILSPNRVSGRRADKRADVWAPRVKRSDFPRFVQSAKYHATAASQCGMGATIN